MSILRSIAKNIQLLCKLDRQHAWWLVKHYEFVLGGACSAKRHIPILHDGSPLPWYTYSALHFLDQFDLSQSDVFEYGSGNSSLYWARKAKSVCSVEIDEQWYKRVSANTDKNQTILFESDPEQYSKSIFATERKFDVIVVDGAVRYSCMQNAIQCLKRNGLLILDNSDWFPNTVCYLQEHHFQQFDFIGLGPINKYTWSTSVFFAEALCLPRKQGNGQIIVCGGIEQQSSDDEMPMS